MSRDLSGPIVSQYSGHVTVRVEAPDGQVLSFCLCAVFLETCWEGNYCFFAFVCFRNFVSVELATKNHLAAGAIKFQVGIGTRQSILGSVFPSKKAKRDIRDSGEN